MSVGIRPFESGRVHCPALGYFARVAWQCLSQSSTSTVSQLSAPGMRTVIADRSGAQSGASAKVIRAVEGRGPRSKSAE